MYVDECDVSLEQFFFVFFGGAWGWGGWFFFFFEFVFRCVGWCFLAAFFRARRTVFGIGGSGLGGGCVRGGWLVFMSSPPSFPLLLGWLGSFLGLVCSSVSGGLGGGGFGGGVAFALVCWARC